MLSATGCFKALNRAFASLLNGPAGLRLGMVTLVLALGPVLGQQARAQIPQKVITTNVSEPKSVHAADLTGDGDMDVLFASNSSIGGKIAYLRNDGGGSFSGLIIINDDIANGESVHAADLTGDGDMDVLSASKGGGTIAWYENGGGGGFSEEKVISTDADGGQSVYAADLTGDGDMDVLSASDYDNKVAWYENLGNGNFSEQQVISTDAGQSVYAADLTGDGDMDVISASTYKTAWYENEEGGSFSEQKVISTSADVPTSLRAADLTGDGDMDVLSASEDDDKIAWYENEGDGNFSEQQVISTSADGAQSVHAADLDRDGDMDVLSASFFDDKIAWYENVVGIFFGQNIINTSAVEAQSVYAADLTGDGDMDVVSASQSANSAGMIAWYENTDDVLPVELTDLSVHANGTGARLTWQTASETNNSGFYVQHRTFSENDWSRLGFVEGTGTTSNSQFYQFETDGLSPGTHKFRVRQVDTDGTARLSKVVSTEIQMKEALKLTAPAPNPASSTATLSFAVKKQTEATVAVYDMLGRRTVTLYEGRPTPGETNRLQFNAIGLPSGSYIIRLRAAGQTEARRMTVAR